MSKCLWCGKECPQTPGRRARLYCNGNCRASYSQKRTAEIAREIRISEGFSGKPGRPRAGIPLKTKKLVKELEVSGNTYFTTDEKFFEGLLPLSDKVFDRIEIDNMIKTIQEETIPPERDTILGRKIWKKEQEERIKKLKNE